MCPKTHCTRSRQLIPGSDNPFLKTGHKGWVLEIDGQQRRCLEFFYVLPQTITVTNIYDTLVVVPNCLQMKRCESPPFFCAASETTCVTIASLLQEVHLPPHTFKYQIQVPTYTSACGRLNSSAFFVNLTEVFVDDFIASTNNTNWAHLTQLSRAMLHGIHSIFPPPEVSGHQGEDPIS